MNKFRQQNAGSSVAVSPRPRRLSESELESIRWLQPLESGKFMFLCPVCGIRLRADWNVTGRIGQCPTCGMFFNVPLPPGDQTCLRA